jgi:hypothetical protein
MRPFLWIVIIIGTPFYLLSGKADPTTALILLGLFALSIGALFVEYRKQQVAKGQRDFWLSQRKK